PVGSCVPCAMLHGRGKSTRYRSTHSAENTMSWQACPDPIPGDPDTCDSIDTVIVPRMRDLGGFEVGRVLPAPRQGMVGPFIFLDQMGPTEFVLNEGIDIRPHPHINLAT